MLLTNNEIYHDWTNNWLSLEKRGWEREKKMTMKSLVFQLKISVCSHDDVVVGWKSSLRFERQRIQQGRVFLYLYPSMFAITIDRAQHFTIAGQSYYVRQFQLDVAGCGIGLHLRNSGLVRFQRSMCKMLHASKKGWPCWILWLLLFVHVLA